MIITYAWPDDHNQKPNSFVAPRETLCFPTRYLLSRASPSFSFSFNRFGPRSKKKKNKKKKSPTPGHLLMKQNGIDPLSDFDRLVF